MLQPNSLKQKTTTPKQPPLCARSYTPPTASNEKQQYKHRLFLKGGINNHKINAAYNEKEPKHKHIWIGFNSLAYKIRYGLTNIECDIVAYYKWRTKFKKRAYTQRRLVDQLGISRSTLFLGLRKLVDLKILEHITDYKADYVHEHAKTYRHIYKWNRFCESGMKKIKIEPQTEYPKGILKRFVQDSQKTGFEEKTKPSLSQIFNKYSESWSLYREHFPNSKNESRNTTLFKLLEWKYVLPTPADLETAIKRASSIKWIKEAHIIGWREASKSRLVAKGGTLNDKSKHWAKYGNSRASFMWICKNVGSINAGANDNRDLSHKAKRSWADYQGGLGLVTDIKRTVTPLTVLIDQINNSGMTEAEKSLRVDLIQKQGEYSYDNWYKACTWCNEAVKLTHTNKFHIDQIYKKFGLVVKEV